MNELMTIWPVVVVAEIGNLAFIAYDFNKRQAELERDRDRAVEFLSSRGVNLEALQERVCMLETRRDLLREKCIGLSDEKFQTEITTNYDAAEGLFDGIIALIVEERKISQLQENKLRKETEHIEAQALELQKRAAAEEERGKAIIAESATKVAEAVRVGRRKPLEDSLAMVATRRDAMSKEVSNLAEAMEQKAAEPDPVKRAAGLSPLIPLLEVYRREFEIEIKRESELEGDLIELSKLHPR